MTFKVLYNFRRPHWTAFGRVAFVEAVNAQDAASQGWMMIRQQEPGAEFFDVEITKSTPEASARYAQKVAAYEQWQANVKGGIANDRKLL